MYVSHISLDDYRSYRHLVQELRPGTTALLGGNGRGKTNLVEGLAYLSSFSSHRVGTDAALVRRPDAGERAPGGAMIRVRLQRGGRSQLIEVEIVRGRANRARLNRVQVAPREVVGIVRTVVFAPEDLELVRGDPGARRRFLDGLAVQMHPVVAGVRADFERVARQRAAALKHLGAALRRGRTPRWGDLDVWDEQYARLGARLVVARDGVARALRGPAREAHRAVSKQQDDLLVRYRPSLGAERVPALDDRSAVRESLLDGLARHREREAERGVNLVGPGRDELDLRLGDMPVKGYASHGESWSVALALRLGSVALLREDAEDPILILDDVFSELDASRRDALAGLVSSVEQVLVTAAVARDVPARLGGVRLRVRYEPGTGSVVEADDA